MRTSKFNQLITALALCAVIIHSILPRLQASEVEDVISVAEMPNPLFTAHRGVMSASSSGCVSMYAVLEGDSANEAFGSDVQNAGDVNNDGYDDVIVGARQDANGTSMSNVGSAHVISGLDGQVLLSFEGENEQGLFGSSVDAIGDVNGDGIGDFGIGAPSTLSIGEGRVEIRSGQDGTKIHTFTGNHCGKIVRGTGDVDGDGFPDAITVCDDGIYVLSGSTMQSQASSTSADALYTFSSSSWSTDVDGGRDVNGDGRPDLVVGDPGYSHFGSGIGRVTVYSGLDGTVINEFYGSSLGDSFGRNVSFAGDIDNDGTDDILVTAPWADSPQGIANVGLAQGISVVTGDVVFENYGTNVTFLTGAVATDINNDGHSDIIVGRTGIFLPPNEVQVYSGKDGSLLDIIDIQPSVVAALGDLDGNGSNDFAVSSTNVDTGLATNAGHVQLFTMNPEPVMTADLDSLSIQYGGAQNLHIDAGICRANYWYLVLGSVTGTTPGLSFAPFGGTGVLPLNLDSYFTLSLTNANQPPFIATLGLLDATGQATASIQIPPNSLGQGSLMTFHHAAVILDAVGTPVSATNATSLTIVDSFTLNIVEDGPGHVVTSSSSPHEPNDKVIMVALADDNAVFGGWSGDVVSSHHFESIVMDSNKSVVATFLPDTDGDGIGDHEDLCPGGADQLDEDGDGTPDFCDPCPNEESDDSDGDGICDAADQCTGDDALLGQPCDSDIDSDSCDGGVYVCLIGSVTCNDDDEIDDADGDGIVDCVDTCVGVDAEIGLACDSLLDSDNCQTGVYECSSGKLLCTDDPNEDDDDLDGVCNAVDACDGDDSLIGEPCDGDDADSCQGGQYVCSSGVLACNDDAAVDDADSDGVCDELDQCPGFDDNEDNDEDGTPNACDQCPDDVSKVTPGIFGCGSPESDQDGDGTPDADDECPADPAKQTPGDCSCGAKEAPSLFAEHSTSEDVFEMVIGEGPIVSGRPTLIVGQPDQHKVELVVSHPVLAQPQAIVAGNRSASNNTDTLVSEAMFVLQAIDGDPGLSSFGQAVAFSDNLIDGYPGSVLLISDSHKVDVYTLDGIRIAILIGSAQEITVVPGADGDTVLFTRPDGSLMIFDGSNQYVITGGGFGPTTSALHDFNNDGVVDIAVQSISSPYVTMLSGTIATNPMSGDLFQLLEFGQIDLLGYLYGNFGTDDAASFGSSIEPLDSEAKTFAIGNPLEGEVTVWTFNGTAQSVATIQSSMSNDMFGTSIRQVGDMLAIGAPAKDPVTGAKMQGPGGIIDGHVYVYDQSYELVETLNSDPGQADGFGLSLSAGEFGGLGNTQLAAASDSRAEIYDLECRAAVHLSVDLDAIAIDETSTFELSMSFPDSFVGKSYKVIFSATPGGSSYSDQTMELLLPVEEDHLSNDIEGPSGILSGPNQLYIEDLQVDPETLEGLANQTIYMLAGISDPQTGVSTVTNVGCTRVRPKGACCTESDCQQTFQDECTGTWSEGAQCGDKKLCCMDPVNCESYKHEFCCEQEGGTSIPDETTGGPQGSCCSGAECIPGTYEKCCLAHVPGATWQSGGSCETVACCEGGACSELPECACEGIVAGPFVCGQTSNPCDEADPEGACCTGNSCAETTRSACSGTFYEGQTCCDPDVYEACVVEKVACCESDNDTCELKPEQCCESGFTSPTCEGTCCMEIWHGSEADEPCCDSEGTCVQTPCCEDNGGTLVDTCQGMLCSPSDCQVTITKSPESFCLNEAPFTLEAEGVPVGGQYIWQVIQSTNQLSPTSGATKTLEVSPVALSQSKGDITIAVTYTGGSGCSTSVSTTVYSTDLDIDSDNDGELSQDLIEDAMEAYGTQGSSGTGTTTVHAENGYHGAKMIEVNNQDADNDGIADYLDGYNADGILGNDDDINTQDRFVPTILELPLPIITSEAFVHFGYTAAAPGTTSGPIRIWTKDANEARNPAPVDEGGDYVEPGKVYSAADLQFEGGELSKTLYVEGIKASAGSDVSVLPITVTVDPDGFGIAHECQDEVTVVTIEGPVIGYAQLLKPQAGVTADPAGFIVPGQQVPLTLVIPEPTMEFDGTATLNPGNLSLYKIINKREPGCYDLNSSDVQLLDAADLSWNFPDDKEEFIDLKILAVGPPSGDSDVEFQVVIDESTELDQSLKIYTWKPVIEAIQNLDILGAPDGCGYPAGSSLLKSAYESPGLFLGVTDQDDMNATRVVMAWANPTGPKSINPVPAEYQTPDLVFSYAVPIGHDTELSVYGKSGVAQPLDAPLREVKCVGASAGAVNLFSTDPLPASCSINGKDAAQVHIFAKNGSRAKRNMQIYPGPHYYGYRIEPSLAAEDVGYSNALVTAIEGVRIFVERIEILDSIVLTSLGRSATANDDGFCSMNNPKQKMVDGSNAPAAAPQRITAVSSQFGMKVPTEVNGQVQGEFLALDNEVVSINHVWDQASPLTGPDGLPVAQNQLGVDILGMSVARKSWEGTDGTPASYPDHTQIIPTTELATDEDGVVTAWMMLPSIPQYGHNLPSPIESIDSAASVVSFSVGDRRPVITAAPASAEQVLDEDSLWSTKTVHDTTKSLIAGFSKKCIQSRLWVLKEAMTLGAEVANKATTFMANVSEGVSNLTRWHFFQQEEMVGVSAFYAQELAAKAVLVDLADRFALASLEANQETQAWLDIVNSFQTANHTDEEYLSLFFGYHIGSIRGVVAWAGDFADDLRFLACLPVHMSTGIGWFQKMIEQSSKELYGTDDWEFELLFRVNLLNPYDLQARPALAAKVGEKLEPMVEQMVTMLGRIVKEFGYLVLEFNKVDIKSEQELENFDAELISKKVFEDNSILGDMAASWVAAFVGVPQNEGGFKKSPEGVAYSLGYVVGAVSWYVITEVVSDTILGVATGAAWLVVRGTMKATVSAGRGMWRFARIAVRKTKDANGDFLTNKSILGKRLQAKMVVAGEIISEASDFNTIKQTVPQGWWKKQTVAPIYQPVTLAEWQGTILNSHLPDILGRRVGVFRYFDSKYDSPTAGDLAGELVKKGESLPATVSDKISELLDAYQFGDALADFQGKIQDYAKAAIRLIDVQHLPNSPALVGELWETAIDYLGKSARKGHLAENAQRLEAAGAVVVRDARYLKSTKDPEALKKLDALHEKTPQEGGLTDPLDMADYNDGAYHVPDNGGTTTSKGKTEGCIDCTP